MLIWSVCGSPVLLKKCSIRVKKVFILGWELQWDIPFLLPNLKRNREMQHIMLTVRIKMGSHTVWEERQTNRTTFQLRLWKSSQLIYWIKPSVYWSFNIHSHKYIHIYAQLIMINIIYFVLTILRAHLIQSMQLFDDLRWRWKKAFICVTAEKQSRSSLCYCPGRSSAATERAARHKLWLEPETSLSTDVF